MSHELTYIYVCEAGVTMFDRYFSYLDSVKEQLPSALADFALDKSHYDLQSS